MIYLRLRRRVPEQLQPLLERARDDAQTPGHLSNRIPPYRDLMHRITLEIFTEIWLPYKGLLASKLGKKVSAILGDIQADV